MILLPESTSTRALELPSAHDLTGWARTALEAHFRRALHRAEDLLGDGGAPREVVLASLSERGRAPTAGGHGVQWRVPLRAQMGEAVHVMDVEVASALVNALLGSPSAGAGNALSSLDCGVLSEWVALLAVRLLGPVLEPRTRGVLQAKLGDDEPVPAPGGDCVEALFCVRAGGISGRLALSLPTRAALELAASIAAPLRPREMLASRLSQAHVGVQARLVTTTLSLEEVASLQVGDVLLLDVAPGDRAELLVNGSAKFVGKAGFMDGRLAFQIADAARALPAQAG